MSEETKNPDQKQPEELSAEDLEQVAGGAIDTFLKLGDLKGESQEIK
jgi:hypothetical protein